MDALSLTPFEPVESLSESTGWRDKAAEIWDGLVERFLTISNTEIKGIGWPLVFAALTFLILVLGMYLFGWTHAVAGP